MISDITIATATTTTIDRTDLREFEKAVGRYNRAVRGYYNRRLPNGKIFLKMIL